MNARLCATVTGSTTAELLENRDRAVGADMVELRLDYADEVDIDGILANRRVPVVVTCRPVWAGGGFRGSEEERRRLLVKALAAGADYVDVEWGAECADLANADHGRRIILSDHDFDGIPNDLEDRYRSMRASGAQVIKIAVHVSRLSELIRLLEVSRLAGGTAQQASVFIGMGPAGLASRLLPDRFESAWTYAGAAVAPGQVDLPRMIDEFRVHRVTSDTDLFGVLGSPLEHSLSPVMHNTGFSETGRDAVYIPLQAADVDDFERFATAFDVRGVSVTAPFKEAVMGLDVRTDAIGESVGAVNTLRRGDHGWEATNTDVPGFLAPLDGVLALQGCRATILGAGGAARGVAVALASNGATVSVAARNQARAAEVTRLVDGIPSELPPAESSWDLLVNTTPVGTFPDVDRSPMSGGKLAGHVVYDLVYNPPVTKLMSDAAAAGCRTIGGLGMLVAQAERQFEWWTGQRPPLGSFRVAAERRLAADGVER